jgi:predicted  nucleic acid-binding Zn-ribbon protein
MKKRWDQFWHLFENHKFTSLENNGLFIAGMALGGIYVGLQYASLQALREQNEELKLHYSEGNGLGIQKKSEELETKLAEIQRKNLEDSQFQDEMRAKLSELDSFQAQAQTQMHKMSAFNGWKTRAMYSKAVEKKRGMDQITDQLSDGLSEMKREMKQNQEESKKHEAEIHGLRMDLANSKSRYDAQIENIIQERWQQLAPHIQQNMELLQQIEHLKKSGYSTKRHGK